MRKDGGGASGRPAPEAKGDRRTNSMPPRKPEPAPQGAFGAALAEAMKRK
jgi:uncharacterized protein